MGLIIVLSVLSAGLLGLVVYFFFSKKSSRALKRAALGAMIAMGLSLGVCGFFILRGPGVSEEELYISRMVVTDQAPVKSANILSLLIFLVVLLGLLGVILFIGMRDRNRKAVEQAIAGFDDSDGEI
jgi:hypothetical protein